VPGPGVDPEPSVALQRALAPLLVDPPRSAVLCDFDGTLSPIVEDPSRARLLEGMDKVLGRLATRFGVVAVVSGRPVSFLSGQLAPADDEPTTGSERRSATGAGIQLIGLYGLEWSGPGGTITTEPGADAWRPVVLEVAARLGSGAPPGVVIEPKGLTVTVHWRRAPEAAGWALSETAAEEGRSGLRAHPGRLSVELRPPVEIDKGTTVGRLVEGCSAACYLGDDLGDLPAFAALARLASEDGLAAVSVAVVDQESAPEVAEAADAVVSGPGEALTLLRWLADTASGINAR
jgi:trehalose 6-phosphate phosphatase